MLATISKDNEQSKLLLLLLLIFRRDFFDVRQIIYKFLFTKFKKGFKDLKIGDFLCKVILFNSYLVIINRKLILIVLFFT